MTRMSNNNYNFKNVENAILNSINLKEEYKSDLNSQKPRFTTVLPPPNITGCLHIGHALVITLQDILSRYHRMKGYDVLWQLGVDHAGIATQLVVERKLSEKGIKKEDLGREDFSKEILKWKEEAQNKIIEQIQKLGASCDFSNIAFTLSPEFNKAVNKAFVSLCKQGLIYQDYRLVNWDPKFRTAISDLEVITKEEEGSLYYIKYFINKEEDIVIATTRPETIFGDTAIAVNPQDKRYINLIGKEALIPLINKRIPIIADDYSNINKGSGAVKITPAHDFNDFEVAKRHNLPLVIIIDEQGKINNNVPQEFRGLTIKEARKKVIDKLELLGCLVKVDKYIMQVSYGDRSGEVVIPLPSKQWFLNVQDMAKDAITQVKNENVSLLPESWKNLYFEWLKNIKPWCISRQLWWGHRIPVWYSEEGKEFVANNEEEALKEAELYYNKKVQLTQDDSVLDTWFSSSLWPFATLGWPDDPQKLSKYYPTNILITGFDIIFFWVARMIMMSRYFLNTIPFTKVFLHALIQDAKGQKMSKTKGNVIDPLVLIDKYGADALRFTLTGYVSGGQNIKFSEKTLEGSRNFVTKIWNSYRFLKHYNCNYSKKYNPNKVKVCLNKWILLELHNLVKDVNKCIENYHFNELTSKIYHFIWNIFCDWYIEIVKIIFLNKEYEKIQEETSQTAIYVFDILVYIIYPIMPFLSQHLYNLINNTSTLLTHNTFPTEIINNKNIKLYNLSKKSITSLIDLIAKIRSIRSYLKILPSTLIDIYINIKVDKDLFLGSELIIKKLAKVKTIYIVDSINPNLFVEVINNNLIIGLDIKKAIDVKQEKERLNKEKNKLLEKIEDINCRLNNSHFLINAPEIVINNLKIQKESLVLKSNILKKIINKLD